MSVIEEALEQGYNTERIDATLRLEAGGSTTIGISKRETNQTTT